MPDARHCAGEVTAQDARPPGADPVVRPHASEDGFVGLGRKPAVQGFAHAYIGLTPQILVAQHGAVPRLDHRNQKEFAEAGPITHAVGEPGHLGRESMVGFGLVLVFGHQPPQARIIAGLEGMTEFRQPMVRTGGRGGGWQIRIEIGHVVGFLFEGSTEVSSVKGVQMTNFAPLSGARP